MGLLGEEKQLPILTTVSSIVSTNTVLLPLQPRYPDCLYLPVYQFPPGITFLFTICSIFVTKNLHSLFSLDLQAHFNLESTTSFFHFSFEWKSLQHHADWNFKYVILIIITVVVVVVVVAVIPGPPTTAANI